MSVGLIDFNIRLFSFLKKMVDLLRGEVSKDLLKKNGFSIFMSSDNIKMRMRGIVGMLRIRVGCKVLTFSVEKQENKSPYIHNPRGMTLW